MSDNKIIQPKVRFKEFAGENAEAWEQRKLGDIVTITMGQSPNGDTYSDVPSDHILVQGNADLVDGWVKPRIWTTQVTKTADAGDLIMSVRAPAGAMGKTSYNAVIGRGVAAIKGNEFIFQSLVRMDANGYWNKLSTGSTFASLNSKDIKEATILIPNKNEQAKIGVFFTTLDNLIALHQRELDNTKTLKQTMLSKMFPKEGSDVPEIRFAGFTEAWEQRKLGEISEKVTEKNTSNTYDETLTNSAELGIITQRDFFDKDISNEKNLDGYYVVKDDDFVYNPRISNFAPVGPIKRNKLGRTGVMSPLYYVFRTHDIDRTYLEYYFDSTCWHRFMQLNGDSGARADRFAIKNSVFVEMPIPFPELDEQKKIGQLLATLTNLITLHQCELETYQTLKQTMLDKMFV